METEKTRPMKPMYPAREATVVVSIMIWKHAMKSPAAPKPATALPVTTTGMLGASARRSSLLLARMMALYSFDYSTLR